MGHVIPLALVCVCVGGEGDLMGEDHLVGHLGIDWKIILKKPEVRVAPVRRL